MVKSLGGGYLVFAEPFLSAPKEVKKVLTGNPQDNQVSIPFTFEARNTTSTARHLRSLVIRDEKNQEIAYGTPTSFVARNVSRFENRLTVSRSGNQYVLKIQDLRISDEARFTAHALFEEINGTDVESKYFVDKAIVDLITQGPPRHCNRIESNILPYNITRLNRYHTYICGNPRPDVTIKQGDQEIVIRDIIEDSSEKHRYRYTFDLTDLKAEDCGSDVVVTANGNGAEMVLTRTLKLEALPEVQEVVARHQRDCLNVTYNVYDVGKCNQNFQYKVNLFDTEENQVEVSKNMTSQSEGFFRYCGVNETDIQKIKNVNVVFHREENIDNVKVNTESLKNSLHPVIELVSTSKEFDSGAEHLQLLTSHAGYNGETVSIISRIIFPNDGKSRSVTSFVIHFDEEDVSPRRQLATGNRDDFNIVNSVPEKDRYTASFESIPGGESIYNLTISPLLYKDDMVKLEAVLFFDEDGKFTNEQAHTILLVRGGPYFCDETTIENSYNISSTEETPVTKTFEFTVCGNPSPKVAAFWGEKPLQLTKSNTRSTNEFSTKLSLSIKGIEAKDCGKKLSLMMEGYGGLLKKESTFDVNFTPKIQNAKSHQIGNCIITKWNSIDTGFCPHIRYTVEPSKENGQSHPGSSNSTLNHNIVCFPSSTQALEYTETKIGALFTSLSGETISSEVSVVIEKEPIIVPEPPKLVKEDNTKNLILSPSTFDARLSTTASIDIKISNQISQDDVMSVTINRDGVLASGNKDFKLSSVIQNPLFEDRLTAVYSETDSQYRLLMSAVSYNLTGDFTTSLFYQSNGQVLVEKKINKMVVKGKICFSSKEGSSCIA
ncbi:uncharacterized protein [Clytia hemisphaerica]|uniref:uncharacterized protein n=1 Tax=Clytia hemisphaerica TaxID=252671 RepID=UPI0034D39C3B